MKNLRIHKRAVSPIIATLLLVAIAVAASVVAYTWVMSMTGNQANKSQTQIAVDKVMFGKAISTDAVVAAETESGTQASTTTTVYVTQDPTNFHVGDYVIIGDGSTGVVKIATVDNTPVGYSTLTVSPALSIAPTDGATVTLVPKANGMFISVRNSGSIAATIDTIYLFKGDSLIFQKTGVNYVIPVGTAKSIGMTESVSGAYSVLISGGQALGTTDTTIASLTFQADLDVNQAYQVKILTNNGFQTIGTYYSPGSFT